MTESPDRRMPRDGQPDNRHEYATWDAAYVLGALSDADRLEFEAHLVGCHACREEVTDLARVSPLLSLLDYEQVIASDSADHAPAAAPSPELPTSPSLPATVDAQTVFPVFRTGNYAPVHDELTAFDLPVQGSIPADLNGWYLRNGPNPRSAAGHWCVADGIVHGIRLENGRAAWYRNRWVRTESFERPFPLYNDDGTRNLHSSIANTHIVGHAGKTLALMEFSAAARWFAMTSCVIPHPSIGSARTASVLRRARRSSRRRPESRTSWPAGI